MNTIVSELLELSRLEGSGAATMDEIVDVCGLLSAAKKSVARMSGIADIEVNCASRAQLYGSTAEIESVIVNLMSNAIRYTPGDGQIFLRWTVSDEGGELTVEDNGIGIEPEHIPRLTERFFRVDPGRSRDEGGVGLGLAIVKYILERHEGRLLIESTPGQGSIFTCRLPASRIVAKDAVPVAGNR